MSENKASVPVPPYKKKFLCLSNGTRYRPENLNYVLLTPKPNFDGTFMNKLGKKVFRQEWAIQNSTGPATV